MNWAVIWGGANVWGEENVPENALSRKFLDPCKRASGLLCRFIFVQEKQSTDTGGGWKTYRTRGGPKPQRAAKGGTQKGVDHFFQFRSPFGNHFVTFFDVFGHFFAYPLLPTPVCGRVKTPFWEGCHS